MNVQANAGAKVSEGKPLLGGQANAELDLSHDQGPVEFDRRQSVIDKDDYLGQEVPKRMSQGPVKSRKMTDLICCIIFALFLLSWISVGIYYTFASDRLSSLDDIMDSEGNYCGVDSKVKDFPYLFMVRFHANYRSVCVKECPKFDYNQIKYNSTGSNTTTIEPLYYEQLAAEQRTSYDFHFDKEITDESFTYDPRFANGYYTEEQWKAYVDRYNMDCYTNDDVKTCKNSAEHKVFLYDSRPGGVVNFCNAVQPKLAGVSARLGRVDGSSLKDLRTAQWMILGSVGLAMICAIFFLLISRVLMDVIIWIQLVIAVVFMGLLATMLYYLTFADMTNTLKDNGATPEAMEAYRKSREYKVTSPNVVVVFHFRPAHDIGCHRSAGFRDSQLQEDQ